MTTFQHCTVCKKSPQYCNCPIAYCKEGLIKTNAGNILKYDPLKKEIITGSKKFDSDKPDLSILSYNAISEISKAFQFGANKYGRYNYLETGFAYNRLISACLRHVYAWAWGEDSDPESGLSHLAHAGACIVMLIDHVHNKIGEDNRYKKESK